MGFINFVKLLVLALGVLGGMGSIAWAANDARKKYCSLGDEISSSLVAWKFIGGLSLIALVIVANLATVANGGAS